MVSLLSLAGGEDNLRAQRLPDEGRPHLGRRHLLVQRGLPRQGHPRRHQMRGRNRGLELLAIQESGLAGFKLIDDFWES